MPTQDSAPIFIPPLMNGMGAAAPIFETKTASFTATAADSGKIFLIVGATAAVVVTLPAINTGPFKFEIVHLSDVDLTVSTATADTMYTYAVAGDADSVGFATSSEKVGGTVEVYCNGTVLAALARISSSYQNVTVTDSD
jgi:hypothetical protein